MKIIPRFIPLLLPAFLVLGGCQLEKLQDPIVIANDIEKEFYIDLKEYLHPTNRQLQLNITTLEDQECQNSSIETDYYLVGREINLSINKIVPPADCVEGMAPAESDILAGKLNPGTYSFDVALRNTVVNKGQLTVSDESFIVKMETQEGIIVLHNSLQKIPERAFWGYLACEESECEKLLEELNDLLKDLAPAAVDFRPGYYGHFEINNNTLGGRNIFLKPPPPLDHLPFLYQLNPGTDENRLKSLLDEFRSTHPDIAIKGFNGAGRIF